MTPSKFNRPGLKPALALLMGGALVSTANAGFVTFDNGNSSAGPAYYYSTALGSSSPIYIDGNLYFSQDEGAVITSNLAPTPTSVNASWTDNGATITATASTNPGGFFTSRNSTRLSVSNVDATDSYYAMSAYGSRTTVQFFSAQALADRALFRWHVSGSQTPTVTGQCVPATSTFNNCSTSRIDFLATTNTAADFFDVFDPNSGMTQFGPGDFTYNIGGFGLNQQISLLYWTSAFVELHAGSVPQGSNFSAFADYSSTYDLIGIDLFDADNNLITDWTLQDLSNGATVFNQNGRIPTSVSEPNETVLLVFGLLGVLGLAIARRRRPIN
jgi:hypothetical protein